MYLHEFPCHVQLPEMRRPQIQNLACQTSLRELPRYETEVSGKKNKLYLQNYSEIPSSFKRKNSGLKTILTREYLVRFRGDGRV
jgi:hypothetical protein